MTRNVLTSTKLTLTTVSLLVIGVRAFNTDEFKKTYCSDELDSYDGLWCENFYLSANDTDHIQKKDFIISEKSFVRISNADIGHLNINFIRKFPNAQVMHFLSTKMVLGSSETDALATSHPLKILTLKSCRINGSDGNNALKSLPDLEEFAIVMPKQLENVRLDPKFFENNKNLKNLILTMGLTHTLQNDLIADGVLNNLPNLEYFSYDGPLDKITEELFKYNQNLTSLRLQDNGLSAIEGDVPFPESLQHLIVSRNHLRNISSAFKGLKNLKMLDLSMNNIGNFEGCTFDDLVKLKVLFLDANELSCFAERHIEHLTKLAALYLRYNYLEEQDLEFIQKNNFIFEIYPQRTKGFLSMI